MLATKNENEWKNKKIFQKFGLFFKILTSTSYAIWLKLDTDLAPHPMGYYVNDYTDPEMPENPPPVPQYDKLQRDMKIEKSLVWKTYAIVLKYNTIYFDLTMKAIIQWRE